MLCRFRAAAILLLLLTGPPPTFSQELPDELLAEEPPYTDFILLGLGWGATLPLTAGFPAGLGVETVESGPLLDGLIRQISIHRTVADRLTIDIDHDSERLTAGELFGGANIYALGWQGREGEAIRGISLGNLDRSIPGSRYLPLGSGGSESFALGAQALAGPVALEGLIRYGGELEGRRRFRGSRLAVQADMPDVAYARAQYFLLPDAGIDDAGLRVARSSSTGPITIDGRRYELLTRGVDWKLDNASARLTLRRPLWSTEELAVAYTWGPGSDAIIDVDGVRKDFTRAAFPDYFSSDGTWLFLRKQGLNSYWEIRGVFALEDLEEGQVPEALSTQVLWTATLAPNTAYDSVADDFRVSVEDGTLSMEPVDSAGRYYPRPFPGAAPYPAVNPFADDNPLYGGPSYAPADASVNTLRVSYLISTDTWRLDPNVVPESVRVTVDGVPLASSAYTVDSALGIITFADGVIGPQSDVEVVYRWSPSAAAGREVVAAFAAGIGDESRGVRNLATVRIPIPDAPAPRLGEEQPLRFADSLDAVATFGAGPGETGLAAAVRASGAVGVSIADPSGLAIVADMEDDRSVTLGTSESAWVLASRPSQLSAGDRGPLRYEDLWEQQLFGGEALHSVGWDNSANPQFTYAEKAGPYNSADSPTEATGQSLVLDVDFPAGSSDPWAAVSTVLSAVDVGESQRFQLRLRGADITPGAALQVYVEALCRMSEDINDNGLLDGETSAAQPGYSTIPSGSTATTILGTDHRGEPNGRRDTEDRNANGTLDVAEEGVAIGGPSPVAEISAGGTAWKSVAVDVSGLVEANPSTFRDLRGIRITVKPSSAATPVSGKILIGEMGFSGSAMHSSSASLSVHEVTPDVDADLAANPFAAAWPAVYAGLHGSAAYREDRGLADKSLACEVVSDIPLGSPAAVERIIAPPADLSRYGLLRAYLLFPGAPPPATAVVTVTLQSGSDRLSVDIPASQFGAGWNEIAVSLEDPWSVAVNGTTVGSLAGAVGTVRRVAKISIGVSGLTAPCKFFTDEWHLAEARAVLETAGLAEVEAGWRGVALSAGRLALLSDPFLAAGVEHRDGSFLGPFDHGENRWHAEATGTLVQALDASVAASGSWDMPSHVDPGIDPAQLEGSTRRLAMGLALDPSHFGAPWLPQLEHRWERVESVERQPTLDPTGLQVIGSAASSETLGVGERLGGDDQPLEQSVSFSRTWTTDSADLRALPGGSLLESSGLTEVALAELDWRWKGGSLAALASRDRFFTAPPLTAPANPLQSYANRLSTLFADPGVALPGAVELTTRDHLSLSVNAVRTRYLGACLTWDSTYQELNVSAASGARDVASRDAFTLSLPTSPDGKGLLVLTPSASLAFAGAYRQVDPSLDEATLLFAPWPALFAVPLGYLWPEGWGRRQEHAAADAFAGSTALAHSSNFVATSFALDALVAARQWFVPSRAEVAVRGETGRDGSARSQKRTLQLQLGKDATFSTGSVGAGAEASFTADYATKCRSLSLSGGSSLQLPSVAGISLDLDGNVRWTRMRQLLDDPALTLFPGVADDPSLVIAPRPDLDTLRAALTVSWAWTREGNPTGGMSARPAASVQATTSTEKLCVESIMTWTAPGIATSSVPVRASFEHSSELAVTDSFSLCMTGKAAAGVERRTGSGDEVLLPAVGFEIGLTGRLRF